ncbi:MAG: hypothetical protein ABR559_09595 [Gemmatimonadota bacterium]
MDGVRWGMGVASLMLLVGCGGGAGDAPDFPTRDWDGDYLSRVVASSTDCTGSRLPPAMPGFQLNLDHHPNNRATVQMGPLVQLRGSFDGDHLEAAQMIRQPIDLPDSLRVRADASDSLDVISYALSVDFAGRHFEGSYVIHAPDIRALVADAADARCAYRYELVGNWFERPATGPAGSP